MTSTWTENELKACVATYLWMLKAEIAGHTPHKKRTNDALRAGPLEARSKGSIEYRFQNISHVLAEDGEPWIDGYKPASNVGTSTANSIRASIQEVQQARGKQRLPWLVSAIPEEEIVKAAEELAEGAEFDFPDSTTYDVIQDDVRLPPKKVIGYAGLLYFRAPIYPVNQSAGDTHASFKKLRAAGFDLHSKVLTDPESPEFRVAVNQAAESAVAHPPLGQEKPAQYERSSTVYARDAEIVAAVERRAEGTCELCGRDAPFRRPDGSPYLEVHHVVPLGEGGSDTVLNAVAICPNCHRACHYGEDAASLRIQLLKKFGPNT